MNTLIASILIGSAVAVLLWQVLHVFTSVPAEDRLYRDVPAVGFRLVWPLIRIVVYYAEPLMSKAALKNLDLKLARAGVQYSLTARQLLAAKYVAALVFAVAGLVVVFFKGQAMLPFVLVAAVLGFCYPDSWLKRHAQQRQDEMLRSLPFFLDVITLSVEAGSNLTGGITQAVQKTEDSALRRELSRVLRDIRSGKSRSDALREFANRADSTAINQVVSGLIQGEKAGANLGPMLRAQAEQLRTQRFQLAEKKAMEAPVKLLAPLFTCIFPMTFVVLGFVLLGKGIEGNWITSPWILWAYHWPAV